MICKLSTAFVKDLGTKGNGMRAVFGRLTGLPLVYASKPETSKTSLGSGLPRLVVLLALTALSAEQVFAVALVRSCANECNSR
jgi:hypothetical protein